MKFLVESYGGELNSCVGKGTGGSFGPFDSSLLGRIECRDFLFPGFTLGRWAPWTTWYRINM